MIYVSSRRATKRGRSLAAIGRVASLGASLIVTTLACRADRATAADPTDLVEGSEALTLDVPLALTTPTYDGSGQTVHPDFAAAPAWWASRGSYLAITPYPGGDQSKENPSLLASTNRMHWRPIEGAPNPIVWTGLGYLSDPDIVFEPEARELWMYYRQVDGRNVIRLVRSGDGKHWSDPVEVTSGRNHTVVSPSVVRRDAHDWWMWAVNAGPRGCGSDSTDVEVRHSSNGLDWTAPSPTSFPSPSDGFTPWHIEVQWIPSREEYWAVYNAKVAGNCGTKALFLSTSPDGVNWTARPNPLLVAGEIHELDAIVYRSTFSYNPTSDVITFWYSGASYESSGKLVWRTVVQRRRREAVFTRTSGQFGSTSRSIPKSVSLPHPP
jgi:hypothetical protein